MAWLTPDALATREIVCCQLRFYREYWPHVRGALAYLMSAKFWTAHGDITVEQATQEATTMFVEMELGVCMPVGAIIYGVWGENPNPGLYLLCDGASYDSGDYPALYAVLENNANYDNGDGTFRVPNLIGCFPLGVASAPGGTGGETEHTLTEAEMPTHDHIYVPPAVNPDAEGPGIPDIGATVLGTPATTSAAGGSQPHNNMPPFHELVPYIRYR